MAFADFYRKRGYTLQMLHQEMHALSRARQGFRWARVLKHTAVRLPGKLLPLWSQFEKSHATG